MIYDCIGFDWDRHNIFKNFEKHNVTPFESEEIFFNKPLIAASDIKHSEQEDRYYALGRTDNDRRLFVVFTIRKRRIRVISSRDMSRKERKFYESRKEKNPEV